MSYDLIVIGAGPAGENGAAQAAYFGHRVAVVEKAREPGGAPVHTGTLPSKTLRETAIYLSGHRSRNLYGVAVEVDRHAALADTYKYAAYRCLDALGR
jgi:NAD(P) transhydrogenase